MFLWTPFNETAFPDVGALKSFLNCAILCRMGGDGKDSRPKSMYREMEREGVSAKQSVLG